jgi:hypothetical protein
MVSALPDHAFFDKKPPLRVYGGAEHLFAAREIPRRQKDVSPCGAPGKSGAKLIPARASVQSGLRLWTAWGY